MIQNAYVGLGSNLGDRAGYLLLAVRGMLDAGLDVIRMSSVYETEPVEYENQPAFLNMVAELRGFNASLTRANARSPVANRVCPRAHARRADGAADHRSRSADL